jgi:DNA polymerase-4
MRPLCDNRCILHLDADAFFASLEQRDDPKLRGRPVAVGTGVVASCSYEARRYGVTTGMRLTEARRLCRELIVLPGEYPRYEQAARRVLAICAEQTPLVEVAALDDLYLDLTGRTGPPPDAPPDETPAGQLAADLRATIGAEVRLSVSIGIGTNKLVSRVATKEAKQRRSRIEDRGSRIEEQAASAGGNAGFLPRSSILHPRSSAVLVPAGHERVYLAPWPARVLPGAGGRLGDRLERLNVARVGEVAGMPAPLLQGLFGVVRGRTLHEQSWGIDPRPVEPCRLPQSVGRRTSFDPPVAEKTFLAAMLAYLLERACSWLRFQGLATKGLTVTLRYGDYQGAAGRTSFREPTDDEPRLKEAARERLGRLYQRRLPLRYLGVELSPLTRRDDRPTLFPDPEEERARRLLAVRDAVRRRFGFTALLTGDALLLANQLDRDRENFRLRTPCLQGGWRGPVPCPDS